MKYLFVFFVLLLSGCISHDADEKSRCEVECKNCEYIKVSCTDDEITEKDIVPAPTI